MIQMRKEKEQELFKEQQQMRGRMADRLAKEYREIEVTKMHIDQDNYWIVQDNTEELLKKAQEEKDLIEKEKEKSKKDKIRRDIETIERHRGDQLKING